MACQEEVKVEPPSRFDLKLITHVLCCEQSFYTDMPHCIGISTTGTCLCCTQAALCRIKEMDEVDNLYDSHSTGQCCSIKSFKEQGLKECTWLACSGRGTSCFICEQKTQYECRFPTTCCKVATQECCCDVRMALPPDEDVPIACSICGKWFKGSAEEIKDWKTGPPKQYMGGTPSRVSGKM